MVAKGLREMVFSGMREMVFAARNVLLRSPLYLGLLLGVLAVLVALAGLAALGRIDLAVGKPEAAKERRVTFLTVNDTYRLDGIADGRLGGLHRLRTLRKAIEKDAPNVVLIHAGDFLAPSMVADAADEADKGRHMIEGMNLLNIKDGKFDDHMFVTIGNHEFDNNRCGDKHGGLRARVAESKFRWLVSNLDFSKCEGMKDMLAQPNVAKDGHILTVNGVKVGLFGIGLTPNIKDGSRYPVYKPEGEAARQSIAYLRAKGVDLVVAITHLDRENDDKLLQELSSEGIDLLVGGHDHAGMVIRDAQGKPRGFKADSEARTAWRIDVRFPEKGVPQVEAQLISLNEALEPDKRIADLAAAWFDRAQRKTCAKRAADGKEPSDAACLTRQVGWTQGPIELEEEANRSQETGFGNWLADLVARKKNAQVAIINSGLLGLNDNLEAGSILRLRHIHEMIRYDDVVAAYPFKARVVCEALYHGFSRRNSGAWPHIAGVRVKMKQGERAIELADASTGKSIPCDGDSTITVAAVPFLFCGGDDYPLRPEELKGAKDEKDCQQMARKAAGGPKLSATIEGEVRSQGESGIDPRIDGRARITRSHVP
jgi:2',3'-cyclic-nucleotide 2'-phosphodiesterase (5'-nucleotidase family)